MSPRTKASLLAVTALGALPLVGTPAQAFPIAAGCDFVAVRDLTDPVGPQTWVELTASFFVGTPDVTSFEVTCWLQTETNLGVGEIANTRHTCSGATAAGVCANPTTFQINASDNVYMCQHVEWTGSVTYDPSATANDLVDDLLRDIFSTGGATTLGGANQVVATVVLAVNNLVATLVGGGTPGLPGPATTHTDTFDADDVTAGVQCDPVETLQYILAD